MSPNRIFIAHGHGELETLKVTKFFRRLGLATVDLHDEDDRGLTVIEKFEYYATPCEAAVALLTPDDFVLPSRSEKSTRASRPNVILELGWFMRHVGRSRVLILARKGTDIPSDIAGVLVLEFDTDPLEASERIRQRLQGIGLIP